MKDNIKINLTNKIKGALLYYFNFEKQALLACTELYTVHNSIADVIILTKNNLIIEVEVKISIADLKHELKKGRIVYSYDNNIVKSSFINKHEIINTNVYEYPNKYYFCVPSFMLKETLEFSEKLNSKYGVLCFDENKNKVYKTISVKKKAYLLHKNDNHERYEKHMVNRICNDLTAKYKLLYWSNNE
jgi:hypothetical protein